MPSSAHAALVISIIASALGALVMCLLVARYGLTPPASEPADAAARRLIVTRFGHALAGVCFVATGVLGLVAVIVQTRHVIPAPPPVVVQPDRAAEARLQTLAAELKAIAARVEQTETRVSAMDSATRRLGDDVTGVNVRTRQLERAVAALPRRVAVPSASPTETKEAPAPRELGREPVRGPERPAATPAPIEIPSVTPPQMPEPAAAPRSSPPALRSAEPRTPGPAARAPEPTVSSRPLPTAARATELGTTSRSSAPPGRATVEAPPRGSAGGAAAAKQEDLGDKLRDDWKTIREGFSTAGDELKEAVRDLGRKLWR